MALWGNHFNRPGKAAGLGMFVFALLAGCGQEPSATNEPGGNKPAAAVSQTSGGENNNANPQLAKALVQTAGADSNYARLHMPFEEAVHLDPPDEDFVQRPPDLTMTGKNVGKIYQAVVGSKGKGGLWEQVKFLTPDGKKIHHAAIIKTRLGDITIELWPDAAPNHVRNFVALARAGYYDGLLFERAVQVSLKDAPEMTIEYILAGCPNGTGEPGFGHIGYWMKSEISDKQHEPGVIGAWHEETLESAGCRFYVALNKADLLNGQYTLFGKISSGLDVARIILNQPKAESSADRPQNPVVIERIVIQVKEDNS
jgi:peptidyl-prolyl cis-trans isomerase B (cyclophilin B)